MQNMSNSQCCKSNITYHKTIALIFAFLDILAINHNVIFWGFIIKYKQVAFIDKCHNNATSTNMRKDYSSMNSIRLGFSETGCPPMENLFYKVISRQYSIVLDNRSPDYYISSWGDREYLNHDCIRIFYTGENICPDFNLCDYGIGYHYIEFGDRFFRLPYYARDAAVMKLLIRNREISSEEWKKRERFCNFVVTNGNADPNRDEFFHLISSYRNVDSPGRHLNNMAGISYGTDWVSSKLTFLANYKFTIAFENASSPGYTTEKIMHAFAANTIPIYWGNPLIAKEFNPKSFINCHEYSNLNEVVNRVIELDNNNDLCLKMLNEECLPGNSIPWETTEDALLAFFKNIFSQSLSNAKRRTSFGSMANYENTHRYLENIHRMALPILGFRGKIRNILKSMKM